MPALSEMPAIGQFIVRREHRVWAFGRFSVMEVHKVTAKQVEATEQGWRRPNRVPRDQILAVFNDRDKAAQLVQSLDGINGTYRQRMNRLDEVYNAQKADIVAATEKQMAKILAARAGGEG